MSLKRRRNTAPCLDSMIRSRSPSSSLRRESLRDAIPNTIVPKKSCIGSSKPGSSNRNNNKSGQKTRRRERDRKLGREDVAEVQ